MFQLAFIFINGINILYHVPIFLNMGHLGENLDKAVIKVCVKLVRLG